MAETTGTGWHSLIELAKGLREMAQSATNSEVFNEAFARYTPHLGWLLRTACSLVAVGTVFTLIGALAGETWWHWTVLVLLILVVHVVVVRIGAAEKQISPWIKTAFQVSLGSALLQGALLGFGQHRAAIALAFFTLIILPAVACRVALSPIAAKMDEMRRASPEKYEEIVRLTRTTIVAVLAGVVNTALIVILPSAPHPLGLLVLAVGTVVMLTLMGVGIFRVDAHWLFSKRMGVALLLAKVVAIIALFMPAMTASATRALQDFDDWFVDPPQIVTFNAAKDIKFTDLKGRPSLWYVDLPDGGFEFCLTRSKGLHHDSGRAWRLAESEPEKERIRQWVDADADRRRAESANAKRLDDEAKAIKLAAEEKAKQLAAENEAARIAEAKRMSDDLARAKAKRVEAERIGAAQQEAERVRLAEQARRASYLGTPPKGRFDYAVVVASSLATPLIEASSAIVEQVTHKGLKATGSLFVDAFICQAGFDTFFNGQGSEDIKALSLSSVTPHLVLVRAGTPRLASTKSVEGAYTFTMTLTAALIDASDGSRVAEVVVADVSGAGVTERTAQSAFFERAAKVLVEKLVAMRAGRTAN